MMLLDVGLLLTQLNLMPTEIEQIGELTFYTKFVFPILFPFIPGEPGE